MELNKIILYTDIDGTIAYTRKGKSDISEKTKDALKSFVIEGGMLGMASGRSHISIRMLFPDLDICLPMIEANGAAVYDEKNDTYLSTNYLDQDVKKEIFTYVQRHNELRLTAMDLTQTMMVAMHDERDHTYFDYPRPMITQEEFFAKNTLKCAFLGEKSVIDNMVTVMKKYCSDHPVKAERSADIFLEVFDHRAGKHNGIRIVKKMKGMDDKILVCAGDYYNDLGMLEEADIAVCPADAVHDVKQLCDYISPYGPDGAFADIIAYLRRI